MTGSSKTCHSNANCVGKPEWFGFMSEDKNITKKTYLWSLSKQYMQCTLEKLPQHNVQRLHRRSEHVQWNRSFHQNICSNLVLQRLLFPWFSLRNRIADSQLYHRFLKCVFQYTNPPSRHSRCAGWFIALSTIIILLLPWKKSTYTCEWRKDPINTNTNLRTHKQDLLIIVTLMVILAKKTHDWINACYVATSKCEIASSCRK